MKIAIKLETKGSLGRVEMKSQQQANVARTMLANKLHFHFCFQFAFLLPFPVSHMPQELSRSHLKEKQYLVIASLCDRHSLAESSGSGRHFRLRGLNACVTT